MCLRNVSAQRPSKQSERQNIGSSAVLTETRANTEVRPYMRGGVTMALGMELGCKYYAFKGPPRVFRILNLSCRGRPMCLPNVSAQGPSEPSDRQNISLSTLLTETRANTGVRPYRARVGMNLGGEI